MCPVSFRPWPVGRNRRVARIAFNPVLQGLTWGTAHTMLRRDRTGTCLGWSVTCPRSRHRGGRAARPGPGRDGRVPAHLPLRAGLLDRPGPTDRRHCDVHQPTLVLASRQDGSVDMAHPEHLAAALRDARLVEVGTPSHLLWLGEGPEKSAAPSRTFCASAQDAMRSTRSRPGPTRDASTCQRSVCSSSSSTAAGMSASSSRGRSAASRLG